MSDALSLLPPRVPIGKLTLDGKNWLPVLPSVEYLRALQDFFERIGGANGLDAASIATLAGFTLAQEPTAAPDPFLLPVDQTATVRAMAAELASVSAQLGAAQAAYGDVMQRLEALEVQLQLSVLAGDAAQRLEALEVQLQPITPGADWEHPGKIGAASANTGAFTTLTATGLVSSAIGFRRSAAAGTVGYMIGQLDGGLNEHGLYWDATNINLVSAATIIATVSTGGLQLVAGKLKTLGGATFHTTTTACTDGAGIALGTLTTAPAAGNPTKWIGIDDNGTVRYIPAW